MSEPLSMNEIEDVVSSVRRLVSPDARPRPVSRDLGMDRLILTPSLRVVAEQQSSGPPVIKLQTVTRKRRSAAARALPSAERVVTETGDELLVPANPVGRSKARRGRVGPSLSELALVAEEAEVVAGDPTEAAAPAKAKRTASPRKRSAAAKAKPEPVASKSVAREKKPAASRKRTSKPAEVAPVLAADLTDQGSVPELTAAPGFAEPAAEFVAEVPAAESTGAAMVENPVLTDRDGNPINLLAEDELIQLLRRVIREELQGVLGEKITRNVRKLVRAEIARALTAQTLE